MNYLHVATGDLIIAAVSFVAGGLFFGKVKEWAVAKVQNWLR